MKNNDKRVTKITQNHRYIFRKDVSVKNVLMSFISLNQEALSTSLFRLKTVK